MATYYIDYVGGADTNNGTTTGTPFKHCPGDGAATDTADGITLAAGDTVVFKGGVTYLFSASNIVAMASGTALSRITYTSGHLHSTPWPNASDRAIMDATNATLSYGDGSQMGVISLRGYSYITVRGFEMKNIPTDDVVGFIVWRANTGGNIIIDDCVLYDSNAHGIIIQGLWDSGTAPSGFTVSDCTIYSCFRHNLYLRFGLDTVLVEENSFNLPGDNPYSNIDTVAANNIACGYGGTDSQTNITIRGNDFNQTLADPSKSHILLQHAMTTVIIEDNYFHGKTSVSAIDQVGALTGLTIRNNVFHMTTDDFEGILRFYTDQGDGINCDAIAIQNNTFVATPKLGAIIYFYRGDNTDATIYTNVDIRNNIIDTDGSNAIGLIYVSANNGATGPIVELATFTCDYNVYQAGTNATPFTWNGVARSFTNWKSDISDDANSSTGSVTFANEAGDNFMLDAADTLALNKGVTIATFADDKNGVARPIGVAWDIGAYEYGANPYVRFY